MEKKVVASIDLPTSILLNDGCASSLSAQLMFDADATLTDHEAHHTFCQIVLPVRSILKGRSWHASMRLLVSHARWRPSPSVGHPVPLLYVYS